MSSEDDYYFRRHDDYNRYRKRNSAYKKRRRYGNEDRYGLRSRRFRKQDGNSNARWIAILLFMFLLGYELFVLKGPLSIFKTNSSQPSSSYNTDTTQLGTRTITNQRVHAIPPLEPGSDRQNERTQSDPVTESKSNSALPHPGTEQTSQQMPPSQDTMFVTVKRTSDDSKTRDEKETQNKQHVSALRLNVKPADDGDNGENSRSLTNSVSQKRRKSINNEQHYSKIAADDTTESSSDTKSKKNNTKKEINKGKDSNQGDSFWQWFQETKGSEKNSARDSLNCADENMRLCQMFYKYLRKYKIRTVLDVSCAGNIKWVSEVINKAGNELWGFKYYCSLPFEADREMVKKELGSIKFVDFATEEWWHDGYPDGTELLFAWDTLPHISYGRVWNFFVKARQQNVKYILVDNYPGILNDPSPKRDYLNLRKHPFRFPAAKEVVQNVTEPGETAKRQLLFYETTMLPENIQ